MGCYPEVWFERTCMPRRSPSSWTDLFSVTPAGRRVVVPAHGVTLSPKIAAGVRPSDGNADFSFSGAWPDLPKGQDMNENKIHDRLDTLFFRVMNQVLRSLGRMATAGRVRVARRTRLDRNLWLDLRVRLSRRKGGAA